MKTSLLVLAGSVVVAASTAQVYAQSQEINRAVFRAVNGAGTQRFVQSGTHEFHVHKPNQYRLFRADLGRYTPVATEVEGQLSRHLRLRSDDQYHYCFIVTWEGKLLDYRERFNDGREKDLVELQRPIDLGIDAYTPNTSERIARNLSRVAGDRGWEANARVIAVTVAKEFVAKLVREQRSKPHLYLPTNLGPPRRPEAKSCQRNEARPAQ